MGSHFKRIKELLGEGEIKDALEIAIENEEFARYHNEFIEIKSRLSRNERERRIGTISLENYGVNSNIITESILKILDDLQKDNDKQETGDNNDILVFNSQKNLNIGRPEISKDATMNFRYLDSLPAGFVSPAHANGQVKQIESICWSSDNEYLLTNNLHPNTTHIWKGKSQELVFTLPNKGAVRKCEFIWDWVYCVEDDDKVVQWKKVASVNNQFGVNWVREKEINLPPLEGIDTPYISHIIHYWKNYPSKIYIVVQNGRDDSLATTLSCTPSEDATFSPSGQFFGKVRGIKWIDKFGLAVLHRGNLNAPNEESLTNLVTLKGKTFAANDVDLVFDSSSHRLVGVQQKGLYWIEETDKSFELRDEVIKRQGPYDYLFSWDIVLSSNHVCLIASGSDYGEILVVDKATNCRKKNGFKVKLSNHERKKRITHLEWTDDFYTTRDPSRWYDPDESWVGHFLISASEDGSIRIYHLEKGKKEEKEIGAFYNCHPVLHPFSWQASHFAYADSIGYVHIFKRVYDPDTGGIIKEGEQKKKKWTTFLDGISELIYGISVIGFSIYWVPKIGFIKGIGWAFVAPFYWIFYEILWIEIFAPLLESIFS